MTVENNNMSVRQRARADRGGKDAAIAMYGSNTEPVPEPVKAVVKNPVKDNYRNASEFYAGPSKPGKLRTRHNESANADSVAYLLTDEGLMDGRSAPPPNSNRAAVAAAAAGGRGLPRGAAGAPSRGPAAKKTKPKLPEAERDHVDHVCAPTNPEPSWRPGVRLTHLPTGMDAPYFEDLDPRPAREEPPVSGKRRVRAPQQPSKTIFLDPTRRLTAEEAEEARQPTHGRTNKSNMSVNVLCLNRYSPQQLNEPREICRPQGPRRWTAPGMPPARPPTIAQVKTHAKDEHDVLGTGRWGRPEEQRPRGLGKGSCRPTKDTANLFAGDNQQVKRRNWVPPNEARKQTAQQKKQAGQPHLLKYYDPAVDGALPAKSIPPHGNRANEESRQDQPGPYRPSRGLGTFAKNGHSTNKSLW